MRVVLFKVLPVVFGGGALAAALALEPGPVRQLCIAVVVAVVFLAWLAAVVARSLPADVGMTEHTGQVTGTLLELRDALIAVGFQQVGTFSLAQPRAILLGFMHPTEPMFATAFQLGPRVATFDMVALLDGERGGLTSGPNRGGATFPSEVGQFRQIQVGASVPEVLELHRAGLAYLRERGQSFVEVTADSFGPRFRRAMGRQRERFLRAPFLYAAVALKRSFARTTAHDGPLRDQPGIERQIRALGVADLPRAQVRTG